MLLMED